MKTLFNRILKASIIALLLSGCDIGDDDDKTAKNNAPQAMDFMATTKTDTELMAKLSATDADGDMLSYTLATAPGSGELSLNSDGSFSYQPAAEFTGTDSFEFIVSDGKAQTTGMAHIEVEVLEVSFASYSRNAFNQTETDEPLAVNGREFMQDVSSETAYDDLLTE